ncbi:MAG TPA: hypothetical protein VGC42_27935 [Kofleriaceae bacterium]
MISRRTALILSFVLTAGAAPAFAKPSDQARKDAAAHAAKGNSASAAAAQKRTDDRAKAEQRAQRNAAAKKR